MPSFEDLVRAFDPLSERGVVAFVGSGPSIDAGLPTWEELLRLLAREVGALCDVEPSLDHGRLLDVAQYLVRLKKDEMDIQQKAADLIKERQNGPGQLHKLIVQIPFAGIITTNYDSLLTEADMDRRFGLPITYQTKGLGSKLKEHFMLHLHGHINDPHTIILTKGSYDRFALGAAKEAKQFLRTVFQTHKVLFIGFGFRDENIDATLRDMEDLGVIDGWSVYGLVPVPRPSKPDPVLDEALRHRRINPIYLRKGNDHGVADLKKWLRALSRAVTRMTYSRENPVKHDGPPNILQEVSEILRSDDYRGLLEEALASLKDRPDLKGRSATLLQGARFLKLYNWIDAAETRQILSHLNRQRRHPRIENALPYF